MRCCDGMEALSVRPRFVFDENVTGCTCLEPGWCERHRCLKSDWLFELCRRRQDPRGVDDETVGHGVVGRGCRARDAEQHRSSSQEHDDHAGGLPRCCLFTPTHCHLRTVEERGAPGVRLRGSGGAVEQGRDRLLEMASLRRDVAEPLIEQVRALDADTDFEDYFLRLLEHFHVYAEETEPRRYLLNPDGTQSPEFPSLSASCRLLQNQSVPPVGLEPTT